MTKPPEIGDVFKNPDIGLVAEVVAIEDGPIVPGTDTTLVKLNMRNYEGHTWTLSVPLTHWDQYMGDYAREAG